MMQAIVSGHLGRYATPSGTAHLLYDLGDENGRLIESAHLAYAFEGGTDTYSVQVKSQAEAQRITRDAHDADIAVRLFILLMDSEDDEEERRELAKDLNDLMNSGATRAHMTKIFFSHPFLPSFDIDRANKATDGLLELTAFIDDVVDHQLAIDKVRTAFDSIPLPTFESRNARNAAREFAISKGAFVCLSRGVHAGDSGMAVLSTYQALRTFPNSREIVGSWTETFKNPAIPFAKVRYKVEDPDDLEGGELFGRAARRAFENAMGQQPAIIEKLREGDIAMARRYAAELVASQRGISSGEYIAKSLCRLSKEAQRVGIVDLQYEWSVQATEVWPEDPMTHGHLVDALLTLHRPAEASIVLERVANSAPSFYATGCARIMRAQGRLTEAEAAYREAIAAFGDYDDAYHAHAGLGGTLRELGKLDESLLVYEAAIRDVSEESILFSGYAATLVELGRLKEARSNYQRAAGKSSFDRLVALNGQASISKLTGDFERAEREYQRIIANYGHDSFAPIGLADLRRLQGNYAEAAKMYRRAITRFPHLPLAHLGLAEALRDANKPIEAGHALRAGMQRFPDDTRLSIAHAVNLRRSGQRAAALEAINAIVALAPKNIAAALEQAHSLKALGYDDQALQAYDAVVKAAPHNVHAAISRASLYAIGNRFEDALKAIEHISPETQAGWRAENLRALIELRSGASEEAKARSEAALKAVPFDKERRMIRSTLASILVKQQTPAAAVEILSPAAPADDEITRIVRLHAAAFLERTAATKAYREARGVTGQLGVVREQIGVQLGLVKHAQTEPKGWLENSVQLAILREAA
ncbi:tetratricopeptide repeat protein [Agrobacterium sp. NPDC090283]|uniref:tetratricopeptide repeat protein n=1 Tax=Agrobacterium sp. NPDC090283 TaxID=3363920 RepID=UPI00383B83BD